MTKTLGPSDDVLMQEYGALINKMNSNESWAYGFVALYFAFLASIGTATGFLVFRTLTQQDALFEESGGSIGTCVNCWLLDNALPISLSVLGILLNVWAIFMVVDYKRMTRVLMIRLSQIENEVHGPESENIGFANNTITLNSEQVWRFGSIAAVGSIMVMFFLPWVIVIAFYSF